MESNYGSNNPNNLESDFGSNNSSNIAPNLGWSNHSYKRFKYPSLPGAKFCIKQCYLQPLFGPNRYSCGHLAPNLGSNSCAYLELYFGSNSCDYLAPNFGSHSCAYLGRKFEVLRFSFRLLKLFPMPKRSEKFVHCNKVWFWNSKEKIFDIQVNWTNKLYTFWSIVPSIHIQK